MVILLLSYLLSNYADLSRAQVQTVQTDGLEYALECPAVTDPSKIIRHFAYTACYDEMRVIPEWVAWELTSEEVDGSFAREENFHPDPDWKGMQAENKDYVRSGYSRGHMAPAGDMKFSEQAMKESFYFTNVCPQLAAVNNGNWKSLEEKCRKWAHKYGTVWIACGPIVTSSNPATIGWNEIVVPDAFFKVVMIQDKGVLHGVGFVFPHDDSNRKYETLAMPIDKVESITGLDFFAALPDEVENAMESSYDWSVWK